MAAKAASRQVVAAHQELLTYIVVCHRRCVWYVVPNSFKFSALDPPVTCVTRQRPLPTQAVVCWHQAGRAKVWGRPFLWRWIAQRVSINLSATHPAHWCVFDWVGNCPRGNKGLVVKNVDPFSVPSVSAPARSLSSVCLRQVLQHTSSIFTHACSSKGAALQT